MQEPTVVCPDSGHVAIIPTNACCVLLSHNTGKAITTLSLDFTGASSTATSGNSGTPKKNRGVYKTPQGVSADTRAPRTQVFCWSGLRSDGLLKIARV